MPEAVRQSGSEVLEAEGLGKIYGLTPALLGVRLRLQAGEALMVVGRNGAGKSTLIETLAGLRRPSYGRLSVFGKDPSQLANAERRRIGVLAHQSFLYPQLTGRENLAFYGKLYGLSEVEDKVDSWLKRVGLSGLADRRVRSFSRGMEQRLAVARAMMAEPRLLLLDEPFSALDQEGVALVGRQISDTISGGAALVMTAHGPVEIEGVTFEIRELVKGRLELPRQERRVGRLRSLWNR